MLLVFAMRGKRLARRAPDQDFNIEILKSFFDFFACNLNYIFANKGTFSVICLIRIFAGFVEIITSNNINSAGAKTMSQSPNTAEKIDRPDSKVVVDR